MGPVITANNLSHFLSNLRVGQSQVDHMGSHLASDSRARTRTPFAGPRGSSTYRSCPGSRTYPHFRKLQKEPLCLCYLIKHK